VIASCENKFQPYVERQLHQVPTPFTLHPSPCTLHPTPYTLHPAPYTLHPSPYTLHPNTLHPTPHILRPKLFYTLNHVPHSRTPTPDVERPLHQVRPTPYTLNQQKHLRR